MKYSVIIPVYNRPDEVDELLESLCRQHFEDFEVVVVEDGSDIACQDVVMRYADRLDVRYFSNQFRTGTNTQLWCGACPWRICSYS